MPVQLHFEFYCLAGTLQGQGHGVDGLVALQFVEHLDQLGAHADVDGVAHLPAVERDGRDTALHRQFDRGGGALPLTAGSGYAR